MDDISKVDLIAEKVNDNIVEMVWFGGISNDLSTSVFHVTLRL